ncbi:SpaH/EbpB family LPXTG-anchored major pilin [Bifidobacterium avesanii]|uniref:SpaH/EbpB family LPXTG-anchored major pilin n=1 Tax=Bifidobacterium avesanii TaxID=1798157 RepID=A0A7K3TJT0_9BIFI|nr:SpaH/EbpB family LPXTG-anchored major pilin [Bifidobacterium avesanii]KAB8290946.1 Gram-positive pilin backbone subunit 2, Cna-B-like domain-containing protein [Bifidobacterium avesanii]NEG78904.1 SpaH/EbpB family LPXTG-anchored major pilin [Bifidobacterium avesanii]
MTTQHTTLRTRFKSLAGGIGAALTALAALAGLLAAVGSGAAPAMAIGREDTGEVTIGNVEAGTTATAYQVLDVRYDYAADRPSNPQYVWSEGVRAWVTEHYPQYIGDDGAVTDQFADLPSDTVVASGSSADRAPATDIAAFTDALSAAVVLRKATPADTVTVTATVVAGEEASARFDLPMGGYLIHVTGGAYVYRAVMANVIPAFHDGSWRIDPVSIASKRALPGVDKSVNETVPGHVSGKGANGTGSDSAGIGETVSFDLRADVPVFPANAVNRRFVLADALDPGLTLNADSITVSGVNAGVEETPLVAGTAYDLVTSDAKDLDGHAVSFLVDMSAERYAAVAGYRSIHVRYTAVVNRNAVVGPGGNRNEVRLQYSTNPYAQDDHRTERDDVVVYAYGLAILKTGSDNHPLTGAEFELLDADGATLRVVAVDEARGLYRLPEAGKTEGFAQSLHVATDAANPGRLNIAGLDQGDYALRETKAPEGYVLNSTPIAFTIADTGKTEDGLGEYTGNVTGQEDANPGYAFGTVANFKGGLPQTGGVGTVVFGVVGALLIAGGAVLMATRVGRRARRR